MKSPGPPGWRGGRTCVTIPGFGPVIPGFGRGPKGSPLKPEVRGIGNTLVIFFVRNISDAVALASSKRFPLAEITAAAEVLQ